MSLLAVGGPKISAIIIAPIAGGMDVRGLIIAPAYMRVGYSRKIQNDENMVDDKEDIEGELKGVSISAFNHIKGTQKGLAIGIFNYAAKQRGVSLGVLNYVKDNPKGLRLLPIFNTHFGKKEK
jgi:hypothetical protein